MPELKPILTREAESRLVFLAKQGDSEAYRELLWWFQPLLGSIVTRNTRNFSNPDIEQDLHSEALLGFAQSIKAFAPERNRRLGTLIHLYCRRQVVELIRGSTKSRKYTEDDEAKEMFRERLKQAAHPDQTEDIERSEPEFSKLDKALAKLTARARKLVRRVYLDGRPLREVAEQMEEDPQQLRSELADALKKLHSLLA